MSSEAGPFCARPSSAVALASASCVACSCASAAAWLRAHRERVGIDRCDGTQPGAGGQAERERERLQ